MDNLYLIMNNLSYYLSTLSYLSFIKNAKLNDFVKCITERCFVVSN
jgi:hypothetical protein